MRQIKKTQASPPITVYRRRQAKVVLSYQQKRKPIKCESVQDINARQTGFKSRNTIQCLMKRRVIEVVQVVKLVTIN